MKSLPGLRVRIGHVFDPLGDEAGQAPHPPAPERRVLHRLEYLVHLEVTVPVDEQLHNAAQPAVPPQRRAQLAVLEVLPVHVRAAQERRQERGRPGVALVLLGVLHLRVVRMLVAAAERVHQRRQHVHETLDRRSLATGTRAAGRRHEPCGERDVIIPSVRIVARVACALFIRFPSIRARHPKYTDAPTEVDPGSGSIGSDDCR